MFRVNASGFQIFFFFFSIFSGQPQFPQEDFCWWKWKLGRFFSPIWNVSENVMKSLRRPFHIFLDVAK